MAFVIIQNLRSHLPSQRCLIRLCHKFCFIMHKFIAPLPQPYLGPWLDSKLRGWVWEMGPRSSREPQVSYSYTYRHLVNGEAQLGAWSWRQCAAIGPQHIAGLIALMLCKELGSFLWEFCNIFRENNCLLCNLLLLFDVLKINKHLFASVCCSKKQGKK